MKQQNVYFVNEYEDKAILMKKLGVTYILDDSIKIAKDCISQGLQPILFGDHTDFLKENPQFNNAKTWKNFRKMLEKIPK